MKVIRFITIVLIAFGFLQGWCADVEIPVIPDEAIEHSRRKRTMPRIPVVTLTDGVLLKIENISECAEIQVEIRSDGNLLFQTRTSSHEITVSGLNGYECYNLQLTIGGTIWTGEFVL